MASVKAGAGSAGAGAIVCVRTPEDRFRDLEGYPFAPHYARVWPGMLSVHYVDEGPRDREPILLMHGEPSWSYLYRHMIKELVALGHRVVAPDLIGFGKSDKPIHQEDYTYERHVAWMHSFLVATNLRRITLFCQDWGGLIGLRLVAMDPDRFSRVVTGNTFLPTGTSKPSAAFLRWRDFSQRTPELDIPFIIGSACTTTLTEGAIRGYAAPFPNGKYQAGAKIFPMLVPIAPDSPSAAENAEAWEVLQTFTRPWLNTFSDQDPITRGADKAIEAFVPGTQGQNHVTIKDAGHFLQEDKGVEIAHVIHKFIQDNPFAAIAAGSKL